MPPPGFVFTVSRSGVEQVLHGKGPGGHVHRYVDRKAREVERVARRLAPKRTGALRASIKAGRIEDTPRTVRCEITCGVYYGMWQERGTGVYAGRGYIRPRPPSKVLVFRPSNSLDAAGNVRLDKRGNRIGRRGGRGPFAGRGGFVFAKRVKGTPARHFMADAITLVAASDPALRLRQVRR